MRIVVRYRRKNEALAYDASPDGLREEVEISRAENAYGDGQHQSAEPADRPSVTVDMHGREEIIKAEGQLVNSSTDRSYCIEEIEEKRKRSSVKRGLLIENASSVGSTDGPTPCRVLIRPSLGSASLGGFEACLPMRGADSSPLSLLAVCCGR